MFVLDAWEFIYPAQLPGMKWNTQFKAQKRIGTLLNAAVEVSDLRSSCVKLWSEFFSPESMSYPFHRFRLRRFRLYLFKLQSKKWHTAVYSFFSRLNMNDLFYFLTKNNTAIQRKSGRFLQTIIIWKNMKNRNLFRNEIFLKGLLQCKSNATSQLRFTVEWFEMERVFSKHSSTTSGTSYGIFDARYSFVRLWATLIENWKKCLRFFFIFRAVKYFLHFSFKTVRNRTKL